MTTNAFTHYQTCFKVEGRGIDDTTWHRLQSILLTWIRNKETDGRLWDCASDFTYRSDWTNLAQTKSTLATNIYKGDDLKAWALRYTELDKQLGRGRFWHTDVGIVDEAGTATVSVRISYSRNQFDLSHTHPVPVATVPKFIHSILNRESGLRAFCGQQQFGLFDRAIPLWKPGHGKVVADYVLSEKRQYPMIVFNGEIDRQSEEIQGMARLLAGKTPVLFIKDDPELAAEVRFHLPKDLRIPFGKIRVFFPLDRAAFRPERHRWFDIGDVDYPAQRDGLINSLLRNYELREERAVQDIFEVSRRITLSKLQKLNESKSDQSEELAEFYTLLQETEEALDSHKREVEQWVQECELRDTEIYTLKSKLAARDSSEREVQNNIRKAQAWDDFEEIPSDLVGALSILSKVHADRMVFAEQAWKSASNYTDFTNIGEAWRMLHHLATTLYEMRFGDNRSVELEKEFQLRSGGVLLGMSEGKSTKRDADLMRLRQIVFEGVSYDVTPHLKWGVKEPKMLRIHFAFDEPTGRIVVGYVGPHLDNATTRTVN